MNFIVQYETEHEILNLPTPSGSWQTNNISDYMDDPTALGVVIRMTNNPDNAMCAIRGYESTYDFPVMNVGADTYIHGIVNLKGSAILESSVESGKNPTFYITGEIHDDFGIFRDNELSHQSLEENDLNAWRTLTITPPFPYTYADIHAVIIRIHGGAQGDYGVRRVGTDPDLMRSSAAASENWHLVEIDSNGQFEFYSSGKFFVFVIFDALPIEVGYLLKNSGIVIIDEPVDENPPMEADWGELDLSGVIPSDGLVAGMYIENAFLPAAIKEAYVRATGTDAPLRRSIQKVCSVTPTVLLTSAQKCEYKSAVDEMEFKVLWWQGLPPAFARADFEGQITSAISMNGIVTPAVSMVGKATAIVDMTAKVTPAISMSAEITPAVSFSSEIV